MNPLKLLIAEDSKAMQAFYAQEISDSKYEKQIVGDGEAAINVYLKWKPQIILLDMNMPKKNGFQVLEELRKQRHDQLTTVIMVTTVSEKSEIIACAKLGIQGYLIKPFKADELNAAIEKYHSQNLKQP